MRLDVRAPVHHPACVGRGLVRRSPQIGQIRDLRDAMLASTHWLSRSTMRSTSRSDLWQDDAARASPERAEALCRALQTVMLPVVITAGRDHGRKRDTIHRPECPSTVPTHRSS